jgi:hypothetical protein
MMEWIKTQLASFDDPFTLVIVAPIVFGILYILVSFFGERGE